MENNLKNETSPYLLQHKDNPVNWYPWGNEAFEKARAEDKPIFLSIGYSTCHWCHVMAHESFENKNTAALLNENFVSIKVDKEERPDIDSIYMNVCQLMTGSGGWPLSVFITPEQKPFFAGTYFPRNAFESLLKQISVLWKTSRSELIESALEAERLLNKVDNERCEPSEELFNQAFMQLKGSFDKKYGGFGNAPKFPMPHNLIFLMNFSDKRPYNNEALEMAERTLLQMYRGGIFDHIGGGFSRYSTDRYYLVPHFEKMLYDNALLIMAYIRAYETAGKRIYKEIAEKTAEYILNEMTHKNGGFFSAQDADSDGEEGKYYVFRYDELLSLFEEETGAALNEYFGITKKGNFEGKNIPNLLHNPMKNKELKKYLPAIYKYRKERTRIRLDDKILTSWNGLMIAAFAGMYRVLKNEKYLHAAVNACKFIDDMLSDSERLYVSYRDGRRGDPGFLDDYAFYIYGLIELYEASLKSEYLDRAVALCKYAVKNFFDGRNGGFYLYGTENEQLIARPKDTYDGAMPSGNSVMTYNMVMLSQINEDDAFSEVLEKQLKFMAAKAKSYPAGYCFYLSALRAHINPPVHIVCAVKDGYLNIPSDAVVKLIAGGNEQYPLINDRTTYYVCKEKSCLQPVNDLAEIL